MDPDKLKALNSLGKLCRELVDELKAIKKKYPVLPSAELDELIRHLETMMAANVRLREKPQEMSEFAELNLGVAGSVDRAVRILNESEILNNSEISRLRRKTEEILLLSRVISENI